MKIENRISVKLVKGYANSFGSCHHTLQVSSLINELTEKQVFDLCEIAGFTGRKTISSKWQEFPEDNSYNVFNCYEVRNIEG